MANRHLSRSIVLQTLFEWDFRGKDNSRAKDVLYKNIAEFGPGLSDFSFLETLIETVLNNVTMLDEIIVKSAPDWPLDRISIVDRNVLRIGLAELIFGDRKEVPSKVAINEAIELAKTFGGESSGRFINGVLGAVYKEMGGPTEEEQAAEKKSKEPFDPAKLPLERLGGAVVYAFDGDKLYLALVHDVFGFWTLAKGRIEEGESEEEGAAREVLEEIGVPVTIGEKVGENVYIASDPERGKIRKSVTYFIGQTKKDELKLKVTGGLDDARWFEAEEVTNLKMYDDIVPIITRAIGIATSQ